jgi:hypothetical protein
MSYLLYPPLFLLNQHRRGCNLSLPCWCLAEYINIYIIINMIRHTWLSLSTIMLTRPYQCTVVIILLVQCVNINHITYSNSNIIRVLMVRVRRGIISLNPPTSHPLIRWDICSVLYSTNLSRLKKDTLVSPADIPLISGIDLPSHLIMGYVLFQ